MSDRLELATEENFMRAVDAQKARPTRAVLTFVVGGETYGVDILSIREIIKLREVTEVPRTPAFLIGIISVRGSVIPVIDLRLRLKLPATPPTRAARILVVVKDGEPYGLLVDAVSGVVRLAESEIEEALKGGMPPVRIAEKVKELGVSFTLNDAIEARLRKAGADDNLLLVIARAQH